MKWLFCCLWMCSELPINACLIHQAVSTGYHVHRTRGCTCTYTYIYMMHMYFANILMHRRLNSFLPVASNLVFSKQVAVTIHKIMTGCECAVFSQWHEALSWLLYSGVINILTVSLARYNYFIMSTFYAAFENITYLLLVILITWLFVCFHSIANRYLSKLYIITGTARVFIFIMHLCIWLAMCDVTCVRVTWCPCDTRYELFLFCSVVAPEVINYDPLCRATDMWSIGVITYILWVPTSYTIVFNNASPGPAGPSESPVNRRSLWHIHVCTCVYMYVHICTSVRAV